MSEGQAGDETEEVSEEELAAIPRFDEARALVRDYEIGDMPDVWLVNRLYLLWTTASFRRTS